MPPDLKALAAKAKGLAPPAIIQQARPGAVFAVKDEAIAFPEERLAENRTNHATRRVIVVQSSQLVTSARPRTIAVVPCSASQVGIVGDWDLLIPNDEPGFDAPKVVAYISLLQPVLKSDLVKCYGYVRDATLLEIQVRIAKNLGMVPSASVRLPPRNHAILADDVATPPEHAVVHLRSSSEPEH